MKSFKQVPGPPKALLALFSRFGDKTQVVKNFANLRARFGDMIKLEIPLRDPVVLLFNPDYCQQVYKAAGNRPIRPGLDAFRYVREGNFKTTSGLLSNNMEDWSSLRSKIQRPMLKLDHFYSAVPQIEAFTEDFLTEKVKHGRDLKTLEVSEDFHQELLLLALKNVTYLGLNMELKSKEDAQEMVHKTTQIMRTSLQLDHGMQSWRYFRSPTLKSLQNDYQDFLTLTFKYIEEAMQNKPEKGFLQTLHQRGCNQKEIFTVTGDMMFGGLETVVSLISFSLYQLAKNPSAQEKLYQEIRHVEDFTKVDKYPFLRAVIKETLRLNPPAGVVTRQIQTPMTIAGYQFPAGTCFVLCHYHMGTCAKYVSNPTSFIPERWIRTEEHYEKLHPYLIKPFGHGHRVCIGKSIALMEVGIFLIKTLQTYRVEWNYSDIEMKSQLVMVPSLPLKFKFTERM